MYMCKSIYGMYTDICVYMNECTFMCMMRIYVIIRDVYDYYMGLSDSLLLL